MTVKNARLYVCVKIKVIARVVWMEVLRMSQEIASNALLYAYVLMIPIARVVWWIVSDRQMDHVDNAL